MEFFYATLRRRLRRHLNVADFGMGNPITLSGIGDPFKYEVKLNPKFRFEFTKQPVNQRKFVLQ